MPDLRASIGRRALRRLGVALVAYGLSGLVLLAIFVAVADAAIQRVALVDPAAGPLAEATVALRDTASAFAGFETSLADAPRATVDAAATARGGAATAARLADGMSLSIFGAQPFLPLAQDFRRQATDLESMARSLDVLARSLEANRGDVTTIREDIEVLRVRLESARSGGLSVEPLRALVFMLVAWLALPAAVALGAGIWVLRAGRR
jgi:hypothetical protein